MEINVISEKDARVLVYAHNGWKYDYLGLFTINEIKQADKIDSKGRILVATIDNIEYRDYKTLVQVSLSKIGEALGYPKGVTPMKYMIGDESQGITQEDIDYCIQDCRILSEAIKSLEATYKEWTNSSHDLELPLTTASMAYRVWCSLYWPSNWFTINKQNKKVDIAFCNNLFNDALESAYVGGRVQVIGEPMKLYPNTISLDRNSMYPSEMVEQVFPDMMGATYCKPFMSNFRKLLRDPDICMWANLTLEGGKDSPPFLATTTDEGRRCWTETTFTGWICEPEIKHALDLGYQVKEIKELHYSKAIRPFKEFVEFFYNLRVEMRKNNDPSQLWIKLILNALYGRFGMKDIAKRIDNDEEIEAIIEAGKLNEYHFDYYDGRRGSLPFLVAINGDKKPSSTWFGFASFTTSYARVSLNKAILAAGDGAYYCDTDSIFFNADKLPDVLEEIELGNELGQWDYEIEEPTNFIGYEPKAYVFITDQKKKIKIRHKGVSLTDEAGQLVPQAGDLTKEQFSRNVIQYRTAMRRNLPLGSKHIQSKVSKRHFGKKSPLEELDD
jgi:DNA polymerase elongation subunit (family B)